MRIPRANPEKTQRARSLRASSSPPEVILWSRLRNRRLGGIKFRRQQAVAHLVVDFYCPDARLVIELDGDQHGRTREQDAARDAFLRSQGLEVLRISARDFAKHEHAALEHILRLAQSRL